MTSQGGELANTAAGSTGGFTAGLGAGASSLVGAVPGLLGSALTPADADAKTRMGVQLATTLAGPGAAAAGGALAGSGALGGTAAGAAGGSAAAGASGAAVAALPALAVGVAMVVGMGVDSMRNEANMKKAIGKFKDYMAQTPGMRQAWEQKVGDVDAALNNLHNMDNNQLTQLVSQTGQDYSNLQTAKSNAISGGGTTSAFDAHLPAAGLNYAANTPNAMSSSNDLIRQAILNDLQSRDAAAGRGLNMSGAFYQPSDLALEFAPEYFKAHHNVNFDSNPYFDANAYQTGKGAEQEVGPYADLLKQWNQGGGNRDELINIGRPFGMATEDVTSTHALSSGDRNVWDPTSLAVLQGMKPGNYIQTLQQMGFQPGPFQQSAGPGSPLTGGMLAGGGEGGPSGEAGKSVGRLQPRNVVTGTNALPRPESDARSEAVFGMRRPGMQPPADTAGGQAAPPPVPGTSQAEPRAFGQGSGFAVAPGGNIGTGGLVTQLPFGSTPGRGNNGGM